MLIPDRAGPGLLFASFLYRGDIHSQEYLLDHWQSVYGKGFLLVPEFNPLSAYYSKEMGDEEKLARFFVASSLLFPRELLLSTKLLSLEWERSWAIQGKRMVNVDIGFLTLENFLLATTKNYSHRIFIGQNVFGDLTYQYVQGSFQTLPWTYPDYVDPRKVEFFTWLRSYLLVQTQKKSVAENDVSLIKK